MTEFSSLELAPPILRAISEEGYKTATPIQVQAIPLLLKGHDLLGIAQTGTGKTAAFALPLLDNISRTQPKAISKQPRVLILAPTRELAGQINDSIRTYGRHIGVRTAVVFGGVSIRPQITTLTRGTHILVATPGRLLDLMNQGQVQLSAVEVFILDEADRMLDMGFINDIKKITNQLPKKRQTLLFSATMPKTVQGLVNKLLNDPVRVEVTPEATTAEKVEQNVMFVTKANKRHLLSTLMSDQKMSRVLVFTRTKHGADRVAKHLNQNGITADAIHGNKAQNYRQRALKSFADGKVRALVATDIAARGIDVDGISHVVNFDLPNEPESYVHRIGRTARAGSTGIAISFCDQDERAYLKDVEKTIRQRIPVIEDHPFHDAETAKQKGPSDLVQQYKKKPNQRRRKPSRGRRPTSKAA
jgi:ATP-dependent RNA helicase RhlE